MRQIRQMMLALPLSSARLSKLRILCLNNLLDGELCNNVLFPYFLFWGLDLRTLRYFVVDENQLDHPTLDYRPTWMIAPGWTRQYMYNRNYSLIVFPIISGWLRQEPVDVLSLFVCVVDSPAHTESDELFFNVVQRHYTLFKRFGRFYNFLKVSQDSVHQKLLQSVHFLLSYSDRERFLRHNVVLISIGWNISLKTQVCEVVLRSREIFLKLSLKLSVNFFILSCDVNISMSKYLSVKMMSQWSKSSVLPIVYLSDVCVSFSEISFPGRKSLTVMFVYIRPETQPVTEK